MRIIVPGRLRAGRWAREMPPVALPTSQQAAKDVSLLKPHTITAARIAANRRNAQKSTGPRTPRGKAQSRMNGLRNGGRSCLYLGLMRTLLNAPPCAVNRTAQAVLTPELAAHPLIAELVEIFRQAELQVIQQTRSLLAWQAHPADAVSGEIQRAPSVGRKAQKREKDPGIREKKRC